MRQTFKILRRLINEVVRDFGRIDILVNNAGITRDTLAYENDRGTVGCCYRS